MGRKKRYDTLAAKQEAYRNRISGKKGNLPVPVLAESDENHLNRFSGEPKCGEARESIEESVSVQAMPTVHDFLGGQTLSYFWEKKKYPNRKAWEIAVVRAERAEKYARMFPQFIREEDLKYQTIEWQYENEGIKAVKKPSTHFVPS